ncbi:MAG: hypothetical protein LKJ25_06245 [Clostridia bacterium]|jgi:hypothetical protein|nr:hypothetical protein [Clostridia bacterium]
MELNEWKIKNKTAKKYAHFDNKVPLNKVWDYINNPENVIHHGFYPFIHYEKKFNKYKFDKVSNTGKVVPKTRELCYSAHVDRYIYSYYSFKLNREYNEYVKNHGIDNVALAYRDNLHKNNIHFAKRAFDFIKEKGSCYVIIGDFTKFFDNLDHKFLKK